jgi:PAS domain S-box-containing protein
MSTEPSHTALQQKISDLEQVISNQDTSLASLKEKAEFFDALKNNTSDLIHSVTPEGEFLFVNQSWQETLGYNDEDLKTLRLMDIVDPECKDHCKIIFQDLLAGEKVNRNLTIFLAKDGRKISVEGRCSTLFKDGKAVAMTGIFRDLSEREVSAQALQESEDRYQDLFENATDIIQLVAPNGQILYVNNAWRTTFGYSDEEVNNLSIFQLISPDCQGHCKAVFQEVITEPKINYIDTTFVTKDGRIVNIEGNAICKFTDGKPVQTQCIFRDVTQKRKMKEELHKAQKIESLGVLAGGIAHDFNNLLTAILGNISLAGLHVNTPDKIGSYLKNTETAIQRAKGLTQQLLTFSKGGAPIKRTSTISDLIADSSRFILRGSGVDCRFEFETELWTAEVDEGQLSQVTQNLVINASQAMEGAGIITIRGRNMCIDNTTDIPLPPGNYIEIQFEDQGCGIPEEQLSKIFDPYFTSKQSGSGLGLAICYSIIKNHDGLIAVRSEQGVGTCFSIYLPALSTATQIPDSITSEDIKLAAIRGKILIMDDEELVRTMSMEILAFLGCESSAAINGEETINLYSQAMENGTPFDLLIMDLTIPGSMGGVETLQQLKALDPAVKALVSSGYANDPVMANFKDYGFCGVIPKPFLVEELNAVLSEHLSSIAVPL